MHERTLALQTLMAANNLTCEKVAAIIGRKANTVRIWRCKTQHRIIPQQTLELLQHKVAHQTA